MLQCYGFKIVGLGESNENSIQNKELPMEWNQSEDSWAFRYRHFKSSMTFLVKGLKLSNKLIVYGICLEQNEVLNIELSVDEFITNNDLENLDTLFQNTNELENLIVSNILRKFIPSTSDINNQQNNQNNQQNIQQNNQQNSQQNDQNRFYGMDYEENYDPLRVYPRPSNNDPLRVFPESRNDIYPYGEFNPRGLGQGGEFFTPGGNLIGPNHPGFGRGINDPYSNDPFGIGMPRGEGPRRRPPGSRFDPFGPPGNFPGNPDNNDLPPPGWYS